MKDVLTTAKAAQLLGVSTRTAQLWVESGQLPSWKTPGGHRRIPRQAVVELIESPVHEGPALRAHAVIFAGEGRENKWRHTGLPALGLLVDVSEDIAIIQGWLASIPPMLIIIESTEDDDRRKLVSSLEKDSRFNKTVIVRSTGRNAAEPMVVGNNRIRTKMLPDVSATATVIIEFLLANGSGAKEFPAFRVPWNETARLQAVEQSGMVGSEPDIAFDRLVRLAAHSTSSPIAMFTLITQAEQWFKSRVGFDGHSTPRDWAFCNDTLVSNEFTVLEDLSKLAHLSKNPTLSEPYGFRFYAGAPVRDPLGYVLGSICVIDLVPRTLKDVEREALTTIAGGASNLIRMRALEQELRNLGGSGL